MIDLRMYRQIRKGKKQGKLQKEIMAKYNLSDKTVSKYYSMNEPEFLELIKEAQYRSKKPDSLKEEILGIYKENEFQKLEGSAVYDYLSEIHGELPFDERTLRRYISFLQATNELNLTRKVRKYTAVDPLDYGKQLQVDFGEYSTRSGMKLYIFAVVLSASRYKYCAFQERPFCTLDVIGHLLDCFEYIGGIPEELVMTRIIP